MSESKRQTFAMIGIVLLVAAGILLYAGLSQPRVYEQTTSAQETVSVSSDAAAVSETTSATTSSVQTNASEVTYPINLNTATYEELLTIDGIGDARANRILQYRDAIGGYSSVEQIKDISGIGDSLYNQISPYLTV